MERVLSLIRDNLKLAIGALVVFIVVVLLISLLLSRKNATVTINDQEFNVKVAKTEAQKQKGLSGANSIGEKDGMLFIFDTPDHYSFWMKDMKFPIDIIYINGDKVVTVIRNAPTQDLKTYQPESPSDKVLEIQAGLSEKYKIDKGSSVIIENL